MAATGQCGEDEWLSWKTFIAEWHNAGVSCQQMVALLFEQGFYADVTRLQQWISYWDLDNTRPHTEEPHVTLKPLSLPRPQPDPKHVAQSLARQCSTKSAAPTAKSACTVMSGKDSKWSANSKVTSPTYSLFPQTPYRQRPTTSASSMVPCTGKSSVNTTPAPRPATARQETANHSPLTPTMSSSAASSLSSDGSDSSRGPVFSHTSRKESTSTSYSVLSDKRSFMGLEDNSVIEGTSSQLTLDTLSLQSLPLAQPDTADSTTSQFKNIPRILAKMEAADIGLPMTECCCADFFSGTKESSKWTPIYRMLIEDPDFRHTLHYTRAVARLCRTSTLSEAMKIRLEEQFEFHSNLLDRRDVKNDAAYAIALELASIRDGVMSERQEAVLFAQRVMREVYGQEKDVCTAGLEIRGKHSHVYEGITKLPINLRTSRNPSNWRDARALPRRRLEEELLTQPDSEWLSLLVSDCQEVIIYSDNITALAKFAATLQPWSFQNGHTHARQQLERVNIIRLARKIRDLLMVNIDVISWPLGCMRQVRTTKLVFEAIGFIVSEAFNQHNKPKQLNEDQAVTYLLNAVGALNTSKTFIIPETGKTINFNRKLLQAMWVCDADRPLFGYQGLHIETCKAKACWKTLSGNVQQFDKATTLLAPTALPLNLMPAQHKAAEAEQRRTGLNKLKDFVRFRQKPKDSSITTKAAY